MIDPLALVIVFYVLKGGGSNKTTAAIETIAAISAITDRLAKQGKKRLKLLLIDLDPQEVSATTYVGIDQNREAIPNLYHVYQRQVPIQDTIKSTPFGFDIVPSNSLLEAIDDALEKDDELRLRQFIEPLRHEYDLIFIDSPPGKRRIATSGLLTADWLIMPIGAETTGLEAASNTINYIQKVLKPNEEYADIVSNLELRLLFTRYKRGNYHAPGIINSAKKVYSNNVLDMVVPDTLEFSRAYARRRPLTQHKMSHPGAKAYYEFAMWILKSIGYIDDK